MCLYSNADLEIKVAEKPIKCQKVIIPGGRGWVPIVYSTCPWKYNTVLQPLKEDNSLLHHLKVENRDEPWCGKYTKVEEGFHAFVSKSKARDCSKKIRSWETRVAIIPKGAEYLEGINGDIVASKMIVFSSPLRYLLWRLFR